MANSLRKSVVKKKCKNGKVYEYFHYEIKVRVRKELEGFYVELLERGVDINSWVQNKIVEEAIALCTKEKSLKKVTSTKMLSIAKEIHAANGGRND